MKNAIRLVLASSFLFASAAFADHTEDNAYSIAQLAYRLADTAEDLERAAREDCYGDYRDFSIGHDLTNITPFDHRDETLIQLYHAARTLHLDASDLYRAAKRRGGFGDFAIEPTNHGDGDRIRSAYARVNASYDRLSRVYGGLSGYQISYTIHNLMQSVNRANYDLYTYVYGR